MFGQNLRTMARSWLAALALACLAALPVGAQVAPRGNEGQAPLLRITQPPAGAKLAQTFVQVQYEVTNPNIAAAASPNFQVRLDNQDAVTTSDTTQNFTGLTSGLHTVTVQLVDANGTPIAGAGATVHFTIMNPNPQPQGQGQSGAQPPSGSPILPSGSSPLPLLSVVGFGVLVGGVVSAMRTRARTSDKR